MQFLELGTPRQPLSWYNDPEPTITESSSAYMLQNEPGTSDHSSGFATEWSESSSESTMFSNDDEDMYGGYIDLQDS